MPLPKHGELRISIMELLTKNGVMKLRDFVGPLTMHFNLTDEEVNDMYPSGNGHIFYVRISWALSYLNMAGLLYKPKREIYDINDSLNGSTTIILIDGKQLANYIFDYGIGMQIEQTIEIKKFDADFWDSMKDE